MKQNVKFQYVNENGTEMQKIECKVEWAEEDGSYDVNFFDRQTGYSNNSSPTGAQGNWWYQDAEEQEIMRSLIEAVYQWGNREDWTEFLTWEDGAEDVFEFRWDGVSRSGYAGEYRELTR